MCAPLEGFPSGQRDQTVNLTRELRWFESTPLHHKSVVQGLGWCEAGQMWVRLATRRSGDKLGVAEATPFFGVWHAEQ